MLNPTPSALKDFVLRALRELSKGRPNVPVRASLVVQQALQLADVPEALFEKAARNANWVGTQTLVAEGLIGRSDKRGWWVLLPTAAPNAGKEDTPGPGLPEETSKIVDTGDTPNLFLSPVRDDFSRDPYILSLLCMETPCFGLYHEAKVCHTCPISQACRQTLYGRLQHIGQVLDAQIQNSLNPVEMEDLDAILGPLEASTVAATSPKPPLKEIEAAVQIESICYRCNGTISSGLHWFTPTVGWRHKQCP